MTNNNPWTAEQATHELLTVLPLLTRIVAAEVRREAGDDTTMPQFRVLSHLAEKPVTLSALAKKRRVSLQSMSELVQTLVERGWVVRTPDPNDRRQQLLHLTDHGRRHYERAQDYTLRRLVPLIRALSPAELAAVEVALPALRRVLAQEEPAHVQERDDN
jgi:DNA-binding MarR family transcriptional regulator